MNHDVLHAYFDVESRHVYKSCGRINHRNRLNMNNAPSQDHFILVFLLKGVNSYYKKGMSPLDFLHLFFSLLLEEPIPVLKGCIIQETKQEVKKFLSFILKTGG